MTHDAEGRVSRDRPPDAKAGARVTTVRKAIIIGVLLALLIGVLSSLVTARLTDPQSDLDEQRAEITQLASKVSQQEVEIAQLTSEGADVAEEMDRLKAEVAALDERASTAEALVEALEAEKANLEEQLSLVNPAPGPSPTALLTVNWVRYLYPDSGPETVVCVTIKNTSQNDVGLFYGESQFSAFGGDDFVYPAVSDPFFLSTPLRTGELRPGESRRGELPYEVPIQARPLTRLVWTTGFEASPEIAADLPAAGAYDSSDPC